MNAVLEVLENRGLVSADAVERLFNDWPFEDVESVQEELYAALDKDSGAAKRFPRIGDPFNFVASASMRGDFGCDAWDCRLRKISLLAQYAALYADKIVVPLALGIFYGRECEYDTRYLLSGTVLCVQHLRPLVEAGVVDFARQELSYCDEHLHLALPEHLGIEKAARELYLENKGRFTVSADPPEDAEDEWPSFSIKGPHEFLEHGRILKTRYEVPGWLKGWRRLKRKRALSSAIVEKSRLVEEIFDDIARDVAIEQALGMKYDAKYLTNLPGEALVLSKFSADDGYFEHCRNVLCAHLTHSVPLLDDVPLATVLKVRASEPEAFLQYRAAIGRIVGEYIKTRKVVGEKEAQEIYSDILLPEVLKLNSEARSVRRAALKRATIKTMIAAGVVGVGVFGGFLPAQLADLVKAIGGINLLRELGESFASIEKNPSQIKNSNFYFLLRLNQEAAH
jgi:hypothetical protein